MFVVEGAQRLVASPRDNRRVASLADPALQQSGELRFVFDDQNAFVHNAPPVNRGNVKLTRVPVGPSGRSPTHSLPPCASTSRRLMYRPNPVPWMFDSRTLPARWN